MVCLILQFHWQKKGLETNEPISGEFFEEEKVWLLDEFFKKAANELFYFIFVQLNTAFPNDFSASFLSVIAAGHSLDKSAAKTDFEIYEIAHEKVFEKKESKPSLITVELQFDQWFNLLSDLRREQGTGVREEALPNL